MTHTAQTETFGDYRLIIETAESYTTEDGILTVIIIHNKDGLLESYTDGMTLRNARDHGIEFITNNLENRSSFYTGFDEVNILGLHKGLVLLKDSTDYVIANQTAFIYARFTSYSDVRDYVMNNRQTGFSLYFNTNDIHHAEELI